MILESAQGPNPSFFFFGGTFIQLGGLLGQGLGLGLGPGLDNYYFSHFLLEVHPSLVPIRPLASKIEERLETGIETWA